ncbi:MAG: glycosyltransferase [Bacteroidetes bacterium]|nr:glycosyltransferase [Bacteroidota bacterium]
MKKKIIHFIYDLGRGGAETMLVRTIKELPEYEHVLVTLFPLHLFKDELQCDKYICFNFTSIFQIPLGIFKFRKLVKKEKPDLVHTHLFWPTVLARLSVPSRIPLLTTIHIFVNTAVEYTYWYIRLIDKWTYRFRKSIIIVVAKGAMDEYFAFLKQKPWKAYVLYTFVDVARFNTVATVAKEPSSVFRLITVGALREQKNHQYLIHAFALLKGQPFELHIYGEGDKRPLLEEQIKSTGANVILKGNVADIEKRIPQYNLFVMASLFEGFSLSVLEAMAMGIPMLLSDIQSFREECADTARYFSLKDPADFVTQLQQLAADTVQLQNNAVAAKERVLQNFTLTHNIRNLRQIYLDALNS